MDLVEARNLAEDLIEEHIPGWHFSWTRHMTVMGQCDHQARTIHLSKALTPIADDDAIRDTILHEIAHAIVGPRYGHGPVWQAKARALGTSDHRLISESRVGNPRETLAPWVGTCPAGHESPQRYFRKPRQRYACSICCGGKWAEEHVINYVKVF